jgi:integrase
MLLREGQVSHTAAVRKSKPLVNQLNLPCRCSDAEGSAKPLPMDSDLAIVLKEHREGTKQYDSQWIFPNPATENPFWPSKIRQNHLVPAGIAAGIGRLGWHTFRHTHSSLLREHEVAIKVQQALLRHADIRTTMNIYTQSVPKAVREANCKVVRNILGKQGGGIRGSRDYQVLSNQSEPYCVVP